MLHHALYIEVERGASIDTRRPPPSCIADTFLQSVERWSDRPALCLEGQPLSYEQVFIAATGLAQRLIDSGAAASGRPCAIYARRSLPAYTGILAAQLSGMAFVPLNPRFPAERTKAMIAATAPSAVIADAAQLRSLACILADAQQLPILLAPDAQRGDLLSDFSGEVYGRDDLRAPSLRGARRAAPSDTAYVMFTSGSTGQPKGVRVRQSNVTSYLRSIQNVLKLRPEDRCTQLFDLTFDLSVHDLFVAWAAGASFHVFDDAETAAPLDAVRRHGITSWFSVPTLAAITRQFGHLQPNALPSLRVSAFCGEPLAASLAQDWRKAAPNSKLFNLYGPTEATIVITAYEVGENGNLASPTVPIGRPLPAQECILLDPEGRPTALDEPGELWLGGDQVAAGYINNEGENHVRFVDRSFPGFSSRRWYRTGDLVRRDGDHGLIFLGRNDLQVKINGYRVELLEIEAALRRATGCELVAALPWPADESGISRGVVGVVSTASVPAREAIKSCAATLPAYMVPRHILTIEDMPRNDNGKIDRNAVRALCAQRLNWIT